MPNNKGFLRKTNNCIHLLRNMHSYLFGCCFLLKKTAGGRTAEGVAQGFLSWYWRHPITLRSLVVRSTDVGPKVFQTVDNYVLRVYATFFAQKTDHFRREDILFFASLHRIFRDI